MDLSIGEIVLFNEEKVEIVDRTNNLLAIEVRHHYTVIGDAYNIIWVRPEWVKTV